MIDLEFVQQLIRAIDASTLDSIEIERGGTRIRLAKTPPAGSSGNATVPPNAHSVAAPAPPPAPSPTPAPVAAETPPADTEPAANNWVDVTSPMVGTFYRAPSPESPAFVEPGSKVTPGDPLCIIEAMKLMNELEAEIDGTIREVLVQNGEPVEYGQVLFRVELA
jgi:acetyl-CoA carboxylase biotin carboxyl carrier protein